MAKIVNDLNLYRVREREAIRGSRYYEAACGCYVTLGTQGGTIYICEKHAAKAV